MACQRRHQDPIPVRFQRDKEVVVLSVVKSMQKVDYAIGVALSIPTWLTSAWSIKPLSVPFALRGVVESSRVTFTWFLFSYIYCAANKNA